MRHARQTRVWEPRRRRSRSEERISAGDASVRYSRPVAIRARPSRRRYQCPPAADAGATVETRRRVAVDYDRRTGRRPHAAGPPGADHVVIGSGAREEAEMVGIMFLYGIWAVLAIGAIVATAMALREEG